MEYQQLRTQSAYSICTYNFGRFDHVNSLQAIQQIRSKRTFEHRFTLTKRGSKASYMTCALIAMDECSKGRCRRCVRPNYCEGRRQYKHDGLLDSRRMTFPDCNANAFSPPLETAWLVLTTHQWGILYRFPYELERSLGDVLFTLKQLQSTTVISRYRVTRSQFNKTTRCSICLAYDIKKRGILHF